MGVDHIYVKLQQENTGWLYQKCSQILYIYIYIYIYNIAGLIF